MCSVQLRTLVSANACVCPGDLVDQAPAVGVAEDALGHDVVPLVELAQGRRHAVQPAQLLHVVAADELERVGN